MPSSSSSVPADDRFPAPIYEMARLSSGHTVLVCADPADPGGRVNAIVPAGVDLPATADGARGAMMWRRAEWAMAYAMVAGRTPDRVEPIATFAAVVMAHPAHADWLLDQAVLHLDSCVRATARRDDHNDRERIIRQWRRARFADAELHAGLEAAAVPIDASVRARVDECLLGARTALRMPLDGLEWLANCGSEPITLTRNENPWWRGDPLLIADVLLALRELYHALTALDQARTRRAAEELERHAKHARMACPQGVGAFRRTRQLAAEIADGYGTPAEARKAAEEACERAANIERRVHRALHDTPSHKRAAEGIKHSGRRIAPATVRRGARAASDAVARRVDERRDRSHDKG